MAPTSVPEPAAEVVAPGPSRIVRMVVLGGLAIAVLVLGAAALTVLDRVANDWVDPAEASVAGSQQDAEGEIFSFGIRVPEDPLTVGDAITFPNNSDRPHTITDRGGTFDTGEIAPGTSDSATFDTPGRFEIFCQINPSTMNALVVVEPGPSPPPETRVQLYDEFREGESRRFDPAELEVAAGSEITVANVGGLPHTLTAEDGSFSTGTVEPGDEQGRFAGTSATVVADDPGTFAFLCEVYPDEMRGTLRVLGDEPDNDDADERAPPDGDEAAAAPAVDDGRSAAAIPGAVAILAIGLAAIVIAVTGRRRPAELEEF